MSKPEWGQKHICTNCSNPYYDMCRTPIVCPKCNTEYDKVAENKAIVKAGKLGSAMDKKFQSELNFGDDSEEDFDFGDTTGIVSDVLDDSDEYYTTNDVSDLFKESKSGKYE